MKKKENKLNILGKNNAQRKEEIKIIIIKMSTK